MALLKIVEDAKNDGFKIWFGRDFPGGSVAMTLLPGQGAWVQSSVRELDPLTPTAKTQCS